VQKTVETFSVVPEILLAFLQVRAITEVTPTQLRLITDLLVVVVHLQLEQMVRIQPAVMVVLAHHLQYPALL
jgi:hypothetical protein